MKRTLTTLAILVSTWLISACSNRPPNCADTETLQLARDLIVNNAIKNLSSLMGNNTDDAAKKFADLVKVELVNVVDEGYRSETKKQSCKGTLKVTKPDGISIENSTTYSTQRTVDDSNGFLLEIDNAQLFIVQLRVAARPCRSPSRAACMRPSSLRWAAEAIATTIPWPRRSTDLYKTELIRTRAPWKNFDAVELAVLQWMHWFNYYQLMESLGYIPPAEVEANFYRQQERQVVQTV